MGIIKKSKRKTKQVDEVVQAPTNVRPISVDDLVIRVRNDSLNLNFKRLKYKGCPKTLAFGRLSKNIEYINMHRDGFIIDMYNLLVNETSAIKENTFKYLAHYLRVLDEHDMDITFNEKTVMWYFDYQKNRVLTGEIKNGTLASTKKFLVFILNSFGQGTLSRKLPVLARTKVASTPILSDKQHIEIGKKLYFGYKEYCQHILNGTEPNICPFYDDYEKTLNRELPNFRDVQAKLRTAAKNRVTIPNWHNNLTRIAFLIASMFTGVNATPLANLRRRDVVFKKGEGDYYELNTIKGRAGYKEQVNTIGFTKRTKEFIDSWMVVSSHIAPKDDDYLFTYKLRNGLMCTINSANISPPQNQVNSLLTKYYDLPRISNSIFRKTRSSELMRATNDIFMVADANNHSTATAGKHYLFGNEDTHNIQLAGAMVAQISIAKGADKKEAIAEVLFKFKDPLSDFEYKKKKDRLPNKTPTGVRCEEPFSDKAKRSLRPYRSLADSNEDACIDFLGCFECEHHALIAEKDDIWLMLSFRETVIESINRPSSNSIPSERLGKVLRTVDKIIVRYEEVAPEEYQDAINLNKEESHPLYDDETSLDDLLGVYA